MSLDMCKIMKMKMSKAKNLVYEFNMFKDVMNMQWFQNTKKMKTFRTIYTHQIKYSI